MKDCIVNKGLQMRATVTGNRQPVTVVFPTDITLAN